MSTRVMTPVSGGPWAPTYFMWGPTLKESINSLNFYLRNAPWLCVHPPHPQPRRLKKRHADAGWLWGFWHRTCLSAQGCERQRRLTRKMGWVKFLLMRAICWFSIKKHGHDCSADSIQHEAVWLQDEPSQIPSRRHFPIKRLKCIEVWFHQLPQIQMHGKPRLFLCFLKATGKLILGFAGFTNYVGNFQVKHGA